MIPREELPDNFIEMDKRLIDAAELANKVAALVKASGCDEEMARDHLANTDFGTCVCVRGSKGAWTHEQHGPLRLLCDVM